MSIFGSLGIGAFTPLEMVANLPQFIAASKSDSLVEFTDKTAVNPLVLVGSDLWRHPEMEGMLQTATNIFAAYYLQAVAMTATIDGVNVSRRLDQFNPRRDPVNSLADTVAKLLTVSTEDFQFALPSIPSLEARETRPDMKAVESIGRDTLKQMYEANNLCVGKMIDVNLRFDDKTLTMPVQVRLQTRPATSRDITNLMAVSIQDRDTTARADKVSAGLLRPFLDFVCCIDLLERERTAIVNDKTGLYWDAVKTARKNSLSGWLSGKPSVATASNMYFISEEAAAQFESENRIRLTNANDRKKLWDRTNLMILFVVNREYEQVDIYYRRKEQSSTISIKGMAKLGGAKGPDIMEIMTALQSKNTAPTF